jgi:hypothetical protein
MLRHYQPPNLSIMDAIQRKELLHLRVEQANEEMQIVLAKMVEALFQTYQPEVIQEEKELTDAEIMAMPPPPSMRKPLTKEELNSELDEAIAECERGDFVTAEELEKEMATW